MYMNFIFQDKEQINVNKEIAMAKQLKNVVLVYKI